MSGTLDKLVRMANQIATEFANQQPARAADATSEHLRQFWDPRMRQAITAHLAAGGAGLGDIAREAIGRLGPASAG